MPQKLLDPVKVLSSIFIVSVLFLHHIGYSTPFLGVFWDVKFVLVLQKMAVGGFFFLSGYKLSKSKADLPVLQFCFDRLRKLWYPYAVAVVLFSFTVFPARYDGATPSVWNFLIHLFALQGVLGWTTQFAYPTIWFVAILFECYVFFVILKFLRRKLEVKILVFVFCVLLSAVFLLEQREFSVGVGGVTLLWPYTSLYLFVFVVGAFYGFGLLPKFLLSARGNVLAAALAFFVCILYYNFVWVNSVGEQLIEYMLAFLSCVSLCLAVLSREGVMLPPHMWNAMAVLSELSLAIFLVHRVVWTILYWLWPGSGAIHWIYMNVFGVCVIILVARFYDKCFRWVRRTELVCWL